MLIFLIDFQDELDNFKEEKIFTHQNVNFFTFYNNGPNLPIYQIGGDMTFVQIQFENFFKYHITVYIGNIS